MSQTRTSACVYRKYQATGAFSAPSIEMPLGFKRRCFDLDAAARITVTESSKWYCFRRSGHNGSVDQENMHPLAHCIYSSIATPLFREDGIEDLLAKARMANAEADITGMLLYVDRGFFQVLEGHPLRIEPLFAKIGVDPRHERVTQIIHEPIARRVFGQWTMGHPNVENRELRALLGTNDFFASRSCLDGLESGRAKKLLAAFANGRWRSRIQSGATAESASPSV